ncbi:hypothetical protein OE749_04110 [Aestuariibacter sp. AA17]|uniref:Uncharacterized protein n=1 Tax=Fluctibacter corallii TaxID=2984329 RepID=A0ABT3A5C2_9ALTE|nr:hypothetical protein [Aestuariibacter sp. AA17]MCV2883874.1 hypothetical protein [Aestuariibacter sp. AA17]
MEDKSSKKPHQSDEYKRKHHQDAHNTPKDQSRREAEIDSRTRKEDRTGGSNWEDGQR